MNIEYLYKKYFDNQVIQVNLQIIEPLLFSDESNEYLRPESISTNKVQVEVKQYRRSDGSLIKLAYCKENNTMYLENKDGK